MGGAYARRLVPGPTWTLLPSIALSAWSWRSFSVVSLSLPYSYSLSLCLLLSPPTCFCAVAVSRSTTPSRAATGVMIVGKRIRQKFVLSLSVGSGVLVARNIITAGANHFRCAEGLFPAEDLRAPRRKQLYCWREMPPLRGSVVPAHHWFHRDVDVTVGAKRWKSTRLQETRQFQRSRDMFSEVRHCSFLLV